MSMQQFFRANFRNIMDNDFPHLKYPAVMRATVTAMSKIGEKTWLYSIKPLSKDNLPEIPNIKSHVEVEAGVGGTVAAALIDGKLSGIVIVDEVMP